MTYQFRQSEPPTPRYWGWLGLLLLAAAVIWGSTRVYGQSAGDPKWFFKGAGAVDQTGYTAKVNSTLYAINGSGNFSLLAQSNFVSTATIGGYGFVVGPASATDNNVPLWDGTTGKLLKNGLATSVGANGASDAGKVVLFRGTGGITASTGSAGIAIAGSSVGGVGVDARSTDSWALYAGSANAQAAYLVSAGPEPTLVMNSNSTGLVINAVQAGGGSEDIAHFQGTGGVLSMLTDGGLNWSSTGAQTTATNLPVFGTATKGVVPASGGGTTNFLRADGTWTTTGGGSGTVTSVAVSGSDGIEIDSGSPVTTSGTIALGVNASTLKTHLSLNNVENTALSTWAGSANITTLGTIATGTWQSTRVGAIYGGTGMNSYALGDMIYSGATDNLTTLAGNTSGTKKWLNQTGTGIVSAAPEWSVITSSDVGGLGTLATQNGTFSGTSSGTNTGDQTSIAGITGTTAQFNTALTDGDFATGGGTATGTNTGDQTTVTGNAGTATALQTGRTINGTTFDGTANITVTAAAGTLTGTTLNSSVVTSSLTSVGTIATGVWNGTDVAVADGGTGASTTSSARTNLGVVQQQYVTVGSGQTTTSTTLADVTSCALTIAASSTVSFTGEVQFENSSTSGGLGLGINGSAAATYVSGRYEGVQSAGNFAQQITAYSAVTNATTVPVANTVYYGVVQGRIVNGGSSSTITVQAARGGSGTLTIRSCSLLITGIQ